MFDVVTVGTATRDVVLTSPLFKVLKDPVHLRKIGFSSGEAECFALGSKIEIEGMLFTTGGGATNTAVTFARQGLKTGALVALGNDLTSKDVIHDLAVNKVQTIPALRKREYTSYAVILLSQGGERTVLVYRNPEDNLEKKDIPFSRLKTRWLYLVPGSIDLQTLTSLITFCARKKINVAINPSMHFMKMPRKKLLPLLKHVKVVILNREEGAFFTGVDYSKEKKIFVKLHEMIPGVAVMTDGPKGVIVSDGFNIYKAGVFKEQRLVDRTGAGDAFGSGFVAGLVHTNEECRLGLCEVNNIKYAIRLASANATAKVEQLGAKGGLLTRKEFNESPRWRSFPIAVSSL